MKNRLTLNDERLKSMDGDGYVKGLLDRIRDICASEKDSVDLRIFFLYYTSGRKKSIPL